MNLNDFQKIKVIEDEKDINSLYIGDRFFYGKSIISQREYKKEGDIITYYEVIRITENGVEYTPIYDRIN